MTGRYHIGAFAKLTGHSVHTIRWYETQGLLPGVERDSGGRRVYLQAHVDHLLFLVRLRGTGMSIADLRTYSQLGFQGWRTLGQRQDLLRDHRGRVEQTIKDAQRSLKLIDAKLAYYAEWERNKKRPEVMKGDMVGKTREPSPRRAANDPR